MNKFTALYVWVATSAGVCLLSSLVLAFTHVPAQSIGLAALFITALLAWLMLSQRACPACKGTGQRFYGECVWCEGKAHNFRVLTWFTEEYS